MTFDVDQILSQFDEAPGQPGHTKNGNSPSPPPPIEFFPGESEVMDADFTEETPQPPKPIQRSHGLKPKLSIPQFDELALSNWILAFGAVYVLGRTPFLPIGIRVAVLSLSSPLVMAIAISVLWIKGSICDGKPNTRLISKILFAWCILQAAGQITG
jgi:hypothetical protein